MQSLDIPVGARNPNGYTRDEILRALRGIDGSRRWSFRYELLDQNNEKIRDLDVVESCTVSQNFLAVIKRTATFELSSAEDINYLTDRIKPYARLAMPARVVPAHTDYSSTWSNNFNGASGDAVTVSGSELTGSAITSVSGTVTYDSGQTLGGGSSVKAAKQSSVVVNNIYTSGNNETTYFRTLFYVPTGGDMKVYFYDGSAAQISATSININNGTGTYTLANGTINLSSISSDLLNQWVRLDVEIRTDSDQVDYKFFWTDPNAGTEPDFETSYFPVGELTPAYGFLIGGDSASANGCWFDETQFGDLTDVEAYRTPTDSDYVEWAQGVFLLSSPNRITDADGVVTRTIEGYDPGQVFNDDKVQDRYVVTKGTKFIDAISDLLGDVPKIIHPINTLVPSDRSWAIGTTKENIINELTQSINYESLTFDEDGNAVIRPYILPSKRTPEYEYADDEVSVLSPVVTHEFDLFEVPNKWVLVYSAPEGDPIRVSLENNNPSDPTSIPRRGRTIVDFREETEAQTHDMLMRKAVRLRYEASRIYEAVEFETAIMPFHSFNDVYTIKFSPLAINDKYTEHTWEMPLEAGAMMKHRARRVVNISFIDENAFVNGNLTVTGALTAGNIAYGKVQITPTVNKPKRTTVTGFNLQGTGRVHVQVTPNLTTTTIVNNHESTVMDETPTSFSLWVSSSSASGAPYTYYWLAMRNP